MISYLRSGTRLDNFFGGHRSWDEIPFLDSIPPAWFRRQLKATSLPSQTVYSLLSVYSKHVELSHDFLSPKARPEGTSSTGDRFFARASGLTTEEGGVLEEEDK